MPDRLLDIRRFALLLLAMFASWLVVVAPARADVTKEVPVSIDWRIGYHGVSTCSSWGLATWRAQKGATGWELLYNFNGKEGKKTLSPPFDDEEFAKFDWHPAPGTHWDGLIHSGRSSGGGNPVTCGDLQEKQQSLYSNVRLRVTLSCPLNRVQRFRRKLNAARKRERRSYRASKQVLRHFLRLQRELKQSGQGAQVLSQAKRRARNARLRAVQDRRQRQRLQRQYRKVRDQCL